MNATLQCMIPIVELRDYFLDSKYQRFVNDATVSNSNDYSRKFAEFFDQVYECDSKEELVLNPTMLKNLIRRRFTPIMQHDSHEFLMHLLSELQDEETRVGDKKFNGEVTAKNKHRTMQDIYREYFFANPSCIDQVFTGIQRSIVKCANCCYESITYKPFSCLSISFESTLKKSLQRNFEVLQFDSDNKYKCEKCYEKTKAKHYTKLCYLPKVLIFHVKRFEFMGRKISKFMEYPKTIDMEPFQNPQDNISNQKTTYKLFALTEHMGRRDTSGHYIAHALRNGKWYSFDDEYFTTVNEKTALNREAYMLFYSR